MQKRLIITVKAKPELLSVYQKHLIGAANQGSSVGNSLTKE